VCFLPRLPRCQNPDIPSELTIRPARRRDANAIAGVHVRSRQAAYRGFIAEELLASPSVAERARSWRGWLVAAGSETIVAESARGIVGFCTTVWGRGAAGCEIAGLYIEPELVRRGIGSALLRAALEAVRANGAGAVTLRVLEANEPARAFYDRFGFAADGDRELDERTGEPVISMRLEL
jgi:ribosomal protein S18 acetylase RimI-like enzyme